MCSLTPGAMSSLTRLSRWLLAKSLTLAFTRLAAHLHNKCTHMTTSAHVHICACTRIELPAAGCRDTGKRQGRHCVSLYYTWNSEPHAFLIEVICTGAACVSVYCVSETVLALIYIPLSHCDCSSEDILYKPQTSAQKDLQIFFFFPP